ncbi:MAG: RusA family crossover junction endodeoxyribonuclease [Peptococcaceae bacterium]|nr:RusA family crossover junction endodeoxyribonuclease [Peptococcaceae bacterium]
MIQIVIKGRPITKKNHSRIVKAGNGRSYVVPSKEYKVYEEMALWQIHGKGSGIDVPCNVKCVYYMPTKHRVDLVNLLEATMDILVTAGVLADDNSRIVAGHDGSRVLYDKSNPRVEITIERMDADAL